MESSENPSRSCKPVSIIVPCYNVEQYLPRCLDSLVGQTMDGIEIICINDGSQDRTLNILQRYHKRYPHLIYVIDKKNEGAWKARRDGIAFASGVYMGFVDGDDYVEPSFCQDLYNTAVATTSDLTVCGFRRINSETGNVVSEEFTNQRQDFLVRNNQTMLLQINGAPWNKLFKSKLLKQLVDFREPPAIFEDIMMHLLVYPDIERVAFLPEALINYNVHRNSIMTNIDKSKIESTYNAMIEVRDHYKERNVSQGMMSFLDSAAFLHLGISLMFRISYDKTASLKDVLRENRAFLDTNFPTWKTPNSISFRNALRLGGPFRNMYLGRLAYKLHLMPLALRAYRFMIDKLGIDMKW